MQHSMRIIANRTECFNIEFDFIVYDLSYSKLLIEHEFLSLVVSHNYLLKFLLNQKYCFSTIAKHMNYYDNFLKRRPKGLDAKNLI